MDSAEAELEMSEFETPESTVCSFPVHSSHIPLPARSGFLLTLYARGGYPMKDFVFVLTIRPKVQSFYLLVHGS